MAAARSRLFATTPAFAAVESCAATEPVLDLLERAMSALASGAESTAHGALAALLDDDDMIPGISATAEHILAELGENDDASTQTRALAWRIYARSREIHSDLVDAEAAVQRAFSLCPSPVLLERLVALTYRRDGSIKALKLIDDGLRRWPGSVPIEVMSAAMRVDPENVDETCELIDGVLAGDPDNAYALAGAARLALVRDDPGAAVRAARGVIPEHPSLGRALLAIGLHMSGRVNEDPALMVSVLADPPADPWLLIKLAEALHAASRPAEALEMLDRAEELAPDDPLISRSRGYTNMVLGRFAEAAFDFERASVAGMNGWLRAMRGEACRMLGDPAGAVSLFRSIEPGSAPTWALTSLGLAELSLGRLDEASESFGRALRQNPDDVNALCGSAEIVLESPAGESLAPAEHLLERALGIDPNNAKAYALLAEVLRRTGLYGQAIVSLDRALALNADYSFALATKGQILIEMGRRTEGFDLMIQALGSAPEPAWILDEINQRLTVDDGEPYEVADGLLRRAERAVRESESGRVSVTVMRARLAREHQRPAQSARLFRRACDLAPADARLALESAGSLQVVGRSDEALLLLDRASPGSGDRDVEWLRIELLWELDRLVDARQALEELVELPDPHPTAWAALGEIYRLDGDRVRARQLLERALCEQPEDPNTLASLGALALDDGNIALARKRLRMAVRIRPDYGFALELLFRLELDAGRTEEVSGLLDRLTDPNPADRRLTTARVVAQYGLGDYETAIETIDDCLALTGEDPGLLRTRGWVEIGLTRPQHARNSFRAAAKLPDADSGVVDSAVGLVRVDLWTDALALVAKASTTGNPFAGTGSAVVWMAAGLFDRAETDAMRGYSLAPGQRQSALFAIRALRQNGSTDRALECARIAIDRWPHDQAIRCEMAECLAAAGDTRRSLDLFEGLLTDIRDQAYRDADHFADEGRFLVNVGRPEPAVGALLRALSATDQPAVILFDLVRASLLAGDSSQAAAVEQRAVRELDRLSAPIRHGLIATEIQCLAAIKRRLGPVERDQTDRLSADLTFRAQRLLPEVLAMASLDSTS